ncbi:DUF4410 domain-containing protein [bacterium]|nr:DUF4410 domain-containing protein [bacterium]
MSKKLFLFCASLIFVTFVAGSTVVAGLAGEMSVLSLRGDTSKLTHDQVVELERVGKWMDRDIIKQLNKVGFEAKLIKKRKDFKGSGHLLIVEVAKFKAGNRAARAFIGFGAGASSLDLKYHLLDGRGKSLAAWEDGAGSSRGGTYCAQTLNRNVIKKLKEVMN